MMQIFDDAIKFINVRSTLFYLFCGGKGGDGGCLMESKLSKNSFTVSV